MIGECGYCKYWEKGAMPPIEGDPGLAECWRHPRVPVVLNGEVAYLYPLQSKLDYCGEFDTIEP